MPRKKVDSLSKGVTLSETDEYGKDPYSNLNKNVMNQLLLDNFHLEERIKASNTFISVCREAVKALQNGRYEEALAVLESALLGYDEGEKPL